MPNTVERFAAFAIDLPHRRFDWNAESQSFDMTTDGGVRICIVGNTDDLLDIKQPSFNAVRLWARRYGNTIVGRIVQVFPKNETELEEGLARLKAVELQSERERRLAEREPVKTDPEPIGNHIPLTELAGRLKEEPEIDEIAETILADLMPDEAEAVLA
jgi:hypothetical protein